MDATLTGTPIASPAIAVRGVTKRYGGVTAVDDLTFEIRPGVVTGFLGPNGAGKTTTLRIVLGLVTPTEGSATILGLPYGSLDDPAGTVGAVLETQSFNPLRNGRNHLRTIATAARIPMARVDEVLEQVGLTAAARRNAGTYSLGMRQRLALGAALLGEPRILILDEPANGLDPQGIRWLRRFLRDFAARGNAVLVSSHVLTEMAELADEAIVIDRGRLVRQAPITELTRTPGDIVVRTPEPDALIAALRTNGIEVSANGDGALHVSGGDAARIGTLAFEACVPVFELSERHTTLEDVFLELTEEAPR
ncbi:MAG TPA: ATP-binding cassette domain-containing protein [Actinomycetota bacterium]|nr:ATP-binding cassette domain-containing protein [Actinomycetota bacterium]